jgi:hypothetical protein
MADGAPNGYSIISFDGTRYTLDFKAAGRAANYQMQITAAEKARVDAKAEIFVNVFNGSERSKVEMKVGHLDWIEMKRVKEDDPGLQAVHDAEVALLETQASKPFSLIKKPKPSTHLWKAHLSDSLSVGTHLIRVRTTDMHGRSYTGSRVIRLVPAPESDAATDP